MTTTGPQSTLDYATPISGGPQGRGFRGPSRLRQRALYCISLPLMTFGLAMSQGAGDRIVAAALASVGAVLLGFALPLSAGRIL